MALKARARPTWRNGRNRSGLPTPPGFKFMTVAQRRASGEQAVDKARGKAPVGNGKPKSKATASKTPAKSRKTASGKAAD